MTTLSVLNNKRYFNKNLAWEEEDEKFDEELEHKHNELLIEEFDSYRKHSAAGTRASNNSKSKEKKRESFDLDFEILIKSK